jgi:predicted phosphodiesterase
MPCITKRIEYSGASDIWTVRFFSDTHIGSANCDEALLAGDITEISGDAHALWLGMGDTCEYIQRGDPRFATGELAAWITTKTKDIAKAERDKAVEMFSPIKDKCLALVEGNHESAILQHSERDVYAAFAEGLGAENVLLGPAGFLRLVFSIKGGRTFTVRFFLTHGWWAGRYTSGTSLPLEQMTGWIDVDVIASGHSHKKVAFPVDKFVCDHANHVYQKSTLCIGCGSYLWQTGYAKRKGYRPTQVGGVALQIQPYYHTIKTETIIGI